MSAFTKASPVTVAGCVITAPATITVASRPLNSRAPNSSAILIGHSVLLRGVSRGLAVYRQGGRGIGGWYCNVCAAGWLSRPQVAVGGQEEHGAGEGRVRIDGLVGVVYVLGWW